MPLFLVVIFFSLIAIGIFRGRKKKKPITIYTPPAPPPLEADGTIQVYHYEVNCRVWQCPNCECENPDGQDTCCVCNRQKG